MEAAKKSLEGLKAPMAALAGKFAALHKQFDALPGDLPRFGPVRARFYGTDEALGRMSAKIGWLSDRLETAVNSGNQQELDKVSEDTQRTYQDISDVDEIALELTHQVAPFERLHKRMLALQEAENSANPSSNSSTPAAAGATSGP